MINATLHYSTGEKQDVNIPTSWGDVTYKQFLRIVNKPPDGFEIYAILLGLTVEQVKKFSIESMNRIVAMCEFLNTPLNMEGIDPDKTITIDGVIYTYKKDIGHEAIGVYEDWKAELKTRENATQYDLIPMTLAHFLRPVGEQYNYQLVEERSELFMNLPCTKAIALGNFFFQNMSASHKSMMTYSLSLTLMNQLLVWSNCLYLVFTVPFIVLLRAIYFAWMMWLKKALMKFTRSCFTRSIYPLTKKD